MPRPAIGGIDGGKGHDIKGNYLAAKPFGILRAVSPVERPRPVAGELQTFVFLIGLWYIRLHIIGKRGFLLDEGRNDFDTGNRTAF